MQIFQSPYSKVVPPIRISISTKNSTPEPVESPESIHRSDSPNEQAPESISEPEKGVEIVETGQAKNDEIDRLFETKNNRQVNALELFDDNEADLSKTKDIVRVFKS